MKKRIFVLFIAIFSLVLCSCEKREYSLIEISSRDLASYILNTEDCDIIFALYTESLPYADEMLEGLEKIAKEKHKNIYYINGDYVDVSSSMILYDGLNIEYNDLIYVVYEDGKEVVYKNYAGYETMASDLSLYKSVYEMERLDIDVDEIISKANELLESDEVAKAYDVLASGWPDEKIKNEFKNKKMYNLINNWQAYYTVDDMTTGYKFYFVSGFNYVYYVEKKDTFEDLKINNEDYVEYKYTLDDNVITLIDEETDKVFKKFTITYLTDEILVLEDSKGKTIQLSIA